MKHLCKSLFFCSLVSLSYMVKHFVCSKKKFANGFINKTSFFLQNIAVISTRNITYTCKNNDFDRKNWIYGVFLNHWWINTKNNIKLIPCIFVSKSLKLACNLLIASMYTITVNNRPKVILRLLKKGFELGGIYHLIQ